MLSGYRTLAIFPLLVLVAASLVASRPHLFAAFSILLACTICYGQLRDMARKTKRIVRTAQPSSRVVIKDLKADSLITFFRPLLRMSILQRMQDYMEERVKSDILRSGSVENPRLIGIKSILYPLMASMVAIPAGIIVFFLYERALIGVVLVPVLIFGFYLVMLKIKAADRRSAIEEEIAPFATAASIMESVNTSLFSTFLMMAKSTSDIFPVMKKEGQRIKNLTALGASPTDALMDLAESHPNASFRGFLEGYVSSFNTGGADTARYLQEQSQRFFAFMQSRMNRYTKQADLIAQVILTVMLLLPMMGLSMMFFATGGLAGTMILLLIVALPLITVVLIGMVQIRQPKSTDGVKVSWIVFVAGICCAVLVYFIRNQIWEAIGLSVILASFLNMFFVRKKFSESASTESALPEFMRQMTRFKNIGIDIMHGIKNIRTEIIQRQDQSKPAKFNRTFDEIIDGIYKKITAGRSLEWAVSNTRIPSPNAKLIFFILGKVHESGGGTAKTLDELTRWITEYIDAKKEMIANLRASLLTAFIGPVLMVMMTVVSDKLASEFEGDAASQLGNLAINTAQSADISAMSQILTVIAVVCMGVVLSKINYFTVQHTMFTGIITAVTMTLLYAVPYFPEF